MKPTYAADISASGITPEQVAEIVESARLCLKHNHPERDIRNPCLGCPLNNHDEMLYGRCFQHRETDPIAYALLALAGDAE